MQTYRFRVEATPETIYSAALAADRWFTFMPGYRGLEAADPDWPAAGASITIRLGAVRVTQTVVAHEHGRRLRMREETRPRLWTDDVELRMDPEDGGTNVTITTNLRFNRLPLRLVHRLVRPVGVLVLDRWVFRKRFTALVEGARPKSGG